MTILQKNLTAVCVVVGMLVIGGQCRGSLAQGRTLETLVTPSYMMCPGDPKCPENRKRVPIRTSPMTASEFARAYDECVKDDRMAPVILATRTPGMSAGIVCVLRGDVE